MRNLRIYIVLAIVLSLQSVGCSKVSFTDASSVEEASSVELDGDTYIYRSNLKVTSSQLPLDIVWVIDNSGSMSQEIAHVKTNLTSFVDQVVLKTDLRMVLLSGSGAGNLGISLPATLPAAQFTQIDQVVGSNNPLYLANAGICSNPMSNCGTAAPPQVQGKISEFFRMQSKKVFVFVTDDESQIDESLFLSTFQETYPGQSPAVFSFVGQEVGSPCKAKTGARYIDLSSQTNGATFNICDLDWTGHFSKLTQNVTDLAVPPLQLPKKMSEISIESVAVDGDILSPGDYKITSAGLVINLSVLTAGVSHQVEVRYKLN